MAQKKKQKIHTRAFTDFGKAFTTLREDLDLTQAEMAVKLKIRQGTISKVESGFSEPRGGVALRALAIANSFATKNRAAKSLKLFQQLMA